jgi:cytochrome c-type biogenesis protein
MIEVGLVTAFVAGVVSFFAPCVLPIIPGFLAYISGATLQEAKKKRWEIFSNSVFFVLGFSSVFAVLGVLLNTVLEAVAYDVQVWLGRIGGALVIFFGLYLTGLIKIPYLEREHKFKVKTKLKSRYATSFLFGAAFAAGWTPCVGAALGAILGIAATQPGAAFWLLLTYALGLGIPFLVVGLFAGQAATFFHRHAKAFQYINVIFGILLIALGVLMFTGQLSRIANFEFLNQILLST